MGTKRQVLKNAFSRSTGVYSYGIGVQKVWTKQQYQKAQKQVNDLIRIVYDVKWAKEDSWRQNDLLRMVNWPPVRLQHAKAALFTLNKVALAPSLKFLFDALNHHLVFPDGSKVLEDRRRLQKYEDDPLDASWIPQLGLSCDDKKHMSKKAKNVFPLSVNHWFKDLPNFIKVLIGTLEFYQAVEVYYNRACWHREYSDCSLCRYNKVIWKSEEQTFENLIEMHLFEENLTVEEFNTTFNMEYFEDYEDTWLDSEDVFDAN